MLCAVTLLPSYHAFDFDDSLSYFLHLIDIIDEMESALTVLCSCGCDPDLKREGKRNNSILISSSSPFNCVL